MISSRACPGAGIAEAISQELPGRGTSILSQSLADPPLIIEARADHVVVTCGAFGGKCRTVSEAMDELARRMGYRVR